MYVLLSPAKKLNESGAAARPALSVPELHRDAAILARVARRLSAADLAGLMGISDALAQFNMVRFQALEVPGPEGEGLAAALLFAGDTYQGFEAHSLSAEAMQVAQERVGILSGLYGLLRPLDAIMPYRLEMGTALKTRRGDNLYDFWGDRIRKLIAKRAKACGQPIVVNCASAEYARAARLKALSLPVVTPVFMEAKNGKTKTISFLAKKARGAMARYIVTEGITEAGGLLGFDRLGYRYAAERSSPERPVFVAPRD